MKLFVSLLIGIILLLTACSQTTQPIPTAQTGFTASPPAQASMTLPTPAQIEAVTSSPTSTATKTTTVASVPTSTNPPTTTPAPQPTRASPYPALVNAAEIPPLGADGMAGLHGLILFRSWDWPFYTSSTSEGDLGNFGSLRRYCHYANGYSCLWAISPDGRSAGLLSPSDFDFNLYLPPDGLPQLVENGFLINSPALQPVRLPEECSQAPDSSVDQHYDQIQFSPDGRYLAYRYGPNLCGRAMKLLDRQTGETVLALEEGVHQIDFLANGKLMISRGHCEGSYVRFFDPRTRQTVEGGERDTSVWNLSRSIWVVAAIPYQGMSSILWGYSLSTGTVFHPEDSWYDEQVIFLPDDRRFLYQHFHKQVTKEDSTIVIDKPVQIVRYDPVTGQRMILAADPAYHYRLCQYDYDLSCPLQWYGDWIQVQRVPFTPFSLPRDDWSMSPELFCLERDQQCATPPESFALNARTGELRPWDPTSLPPANPPPAEGPDLLSQPVYADPAGQFQFYVGLDHTSLWRVPRDGAAVQWIKNSDGFFYLR